MRVELPPTYPYKSPSIGFLNKIFHPNVDLRSGSVCLDVINQTWSPMFGIITFNQILILTVRPDLINIFESFLPQLLLYPNPSDPLNGEAAALLLREPEKYKERVKELVQKFASEASMDVEEEKSEESELSDLSDGGEADDLELDDD